MATMTLWFLMGMILLNSACWLFSKMSSPVVRGGYGLAFSLSGHLLHNLNINAESLAWWQLTGAMILSTLPLLALAYGLYHLRLLFQTYGRREKYFSAAATRHLGKMGQAIIMWTALNLLCEPVLSVWLTMREPVGHRLVAVSFSVQDIVALFLAACIIIIAQILRKTSELHAENQQFI